MLDVTAKQDKIWMEHYIPPHPAVIRTLRPLFNGKKDGEPFFEYNSFQMWVKRAKIPMSRFNGHFVLGDLRKFAEQYATLSAGSNQTEPAYSLTACQAWTGRTTNIPRRPRV